jgi:hypothetical protein
MCTRALTTLCMWYDCSTAWVHYGMTAVRYGCIWHECMRIRWPHALQWTPAASLWSCLFTEWSNGKKWRKPLPATCQYVARQIRGAMLSPLCTALVSVHISIWAPKCDPSSQHSAEKCQQSALAWSTSAHGLEAEAGMQYLHSSQEKIGFFLSCAFSYCRLPGWRAWWWRAWWWRAWWWRAWRWRHGRWTAVDAWPSNKSVSDDTHAVVKLGDQQH